MSIAEQPRSSTDSTSPAPAKPPRKSRRGGLIALVLLVAVAGGGYAVWKSGSWQSSDQTFVYHTVKRGNLSISVTERGTLESQDNVMVHCEVDDVRGDGVEGATIVWIVANGSSVKKGDLIVELDTSGYQDQLDRQILDTEKARAEQIQAKAKYENQITQNKTTEANANLAVRLSELSLEMFNDKESGTHQLEVEAIKRLIDDINNEILAAQGTMELKRNDKQGIEAMFKLGYAGKSEVDRYRLEFLQAEGSFAAKLNKLSTQLATLKKKETFEYEMQKLTLNGDLETARRNRDQVVRDNVALLDQALAAKDAADRALQKEEERLERYRTQLKNCKIHAPQDGMIVYAVADPRRWWLSEVREGGNVRPRQHILSIPNLRQMQVKTGIHESVLEDVTEGLKAEIRVEASADQRFAGDVKSVAVMAEQQGPDVKVYSTIITIDDEVKNLKPGMTAVVEIKVAELTDVLSVPVQSIVQVERSNWVYVDAGVGSPEQRMVKLGRTNDEFVEILDGLEEGDRVVLNPPASLDESNEQKAATDSDSTDAGPDGAGEATDSENDTEPSKDSAPAETTPPAAEAAAEPTK